ncbi:MAG: Holliday junction resolvase RuvX [Thermodesulfobacteriota bacterium]
MRVLGLDIGKKRTGVAISDEAGLVATPLRTIKSSGRRSLLRAITEIIKEYDVGEIVLGLPLNLNGSEGPRAREARDFAAALQQATGLTVRCWDERFSTAAVTRVLLEADLSRARRREVVDKSAAAYILQGFLESRRNGP